MSIINTIIYTLGADGILRAPGGRLVYPALYNPTPPPPSNYYAPYDYGTQDLGPSNTGPWVPAGGLTRFDGNIVINTGDLVSGLDIYGTVTFNGQGTLQDCIVRGLTTAQWNDTVANGGWYGTGNGCIQGKSFNLQGSLIQRVKIDATGRESLWCNDISGSGYTAKYVEVKRTNDGISISTGFPTTLESVWVHNGAYFSWHDSTSGSYNPANPKAGFPAGQPLAGIVGAGAPTSPSDHRSHSDTIQIGNGGLHQILGCKLGGTPGIASSAGLQYLDPRITTVDTAHGFTMSPAQMIAAVNAGDDYQNTGILSAAASSKITALIDKTVFIGSSGARFNIDAKPALSDDCSGITLSNCSFTGSQGYDLYLGHGANPNIVNCFRTDGKALVRGTF